METIVTGILLAIGFYIASAVLSIIGLVTVGIIGVIASIFSRGK